MRTTISPRSFLRPISLCIVLGLAGCTSGDTSSPSTTADFESDRSAPADGLTAVDWVFGLVEIEGVPLEPPADNRTSMTLNDDGTVVGSGGCNEFAGSWTTDSTGEIGFDDFAVQTESCGALQDWDEAIELLETLDQWSLEDLTLVLTNASGDRIIAVAS